MQWCFWDMRPTIRVESNNIFVALGYGLSDLMFTHPIGKSQSKGRLLTISILKRS